MASKALRVLIISPLYPDPVNSGGATRLRNLIAQTGQHHKVSFIALTQPDQVCNPSPLPGLAEPATLIRGKINTTLPQRLGEAVSPSNWPRTIQRLLDRLGGLPTMAVRAYFPDLERAIRAKLAKERFDVVQLEFTEMGRYARLLKRVAPEAAIVLEEIDISYIAMERALNLSEPADKPVLKRELARLTPFEQRLWAECDAVVAMSDVDRAQIINHGVSSGKVWTVPNGVDTSYFTFSEAQRDANRLLFIGYFKHTPNVTGLRHFVANVWPAARARYPELTLDVVGAAAPEDIRLMHGRDGVAVHGYVDDVRPLMAGSSAAIVPILHGGGTRLKVLEAFAAGLPVISTTIGCEGLDVQSGVNVLLADTPDDFVDAVGYLISDPANAQGLAAAARSLVERRYSWTAIGSKLEQVWYNAAGEGRGPNRTR